MMTRNSMFTRAHRNLRWGMAVVVSMFSAPALGQLVDAMGDAQDIFGAGPPLLDIDTILVTFDDTTLFFTMTFHTPVTAPSLNMPDGVIGLLEFDTDQNAGTGNPAIQNNWSPPFATLVVGVDFFLDGFSETFHPGSVDLIDVSAGIIVDTVPISYGPMSLSLEIPLASLGGDDGIVDFTATIGTIPQPTDATDEVGTSVPSAMCFDVINEEVTCHADGVTFTYTVQGTDACSGGLNTYTFTASDGAIGEDFCFTLLVNDAQGGFCCTTMICFAVPDCTNSTSSSDLDGDGVVSIKDLLTLLSAWGTDPGGPPDLDGDNNVGITDLMTLLAAWGPSS